MLENIYNVQSDLHSFLLLLQAGDIERNPGPTLFVTCPNCNEKVHVKKMFCECGHKISKRKGRPIGTTSRAGFKVSTGRAIGTTAEAGYGVSSGRTVGTTAESGYRVSSGRAVGTTAEAGYRVFSGRVVGTTAEAGYRVSSGRAVGTTAEAGYRVSSGRVVGTTAEAGYGVSSGRAVGTTAEAGHRVSTGRALGTTKEAGFHVSCGRPVKYNSNDNIKSVQQIEQYGADENCLSLTPELLGLAYRRIAQQKRFDSKPLAVGMCYCCGSILWSRVDKSHTSLVDIDLTEKKIPAVAYQKALLSAGKGLLEYCHKSGKMYACAVCKTFECPSGYKFHIGYFNETLPIEKWDLTFPRVILNLTLCYPSLI